MEDLAKRVSLPNPFDFNPAECSADTAVVSTLPPEATAVTYQPETFLEYAQRRSMPIISPPIEVDPREPTLDDLARRGFDPEDFLARIEPRPLFLDGPPKPLPQRKVRSTLLHALFELAGPAS